MPTTSPIPRRLARRRPGCRPGCHVPRRDPAHLHPAEVGCRRQGVPHGLARFGEGHPCLPRPRWRRHPDQGGGRSRLAPHDGAGRDRRRGGASRADLDANPKDGKVSARRAGRRPPARPGPVPRPGRPRWRSTATMPCSITSTATRTARSARTSWPHAVTSLHRFDLDGDELIDPNELEPFSNPIAAMNEEHDAAGEVRDGTARDRALGRRPLVPSRPARAQEIRQGDRARARPAGDNRLSPAEFAIDPKDFASSDTDSDGALDTEELRRFLSRVEPDLELVVKLSGERLGRPRRSRRRRGLQALAAARSAFRNSPTATSRSPSARSAWNSTPMAASTPPRMPRATMPASSRPPTRTTTSISRSRK